MFEVLFACCHHEVARHGRKYRFKNQMLSIDATVIELCTSLFDWAKSRRTKGAVKLHLVHDHDGNLPSVAVITMASRSTCVSLGGGALRRGRF